MDKAFSKYSNISGFFFQALCLYFHWCYTEVRYDNLVQEIPVYLSSKPEISSSLL